MQYPAKYLVGIQDYEKIRKDGYVYVDNTALKAEFDALIVFGAASDKECRKLVKLLKVAAVNRGCLYDGAI